MSGNRNGFSANDLDGVDLIPKIFAEQSFGDSGSRRFSGVYKWRKPGAAPVDFSPSWNLKLNLFTSFNQYRGSLVVYRAYSERSLLLDVNLFDLEFPIALADALDRTLHRVVTLPEAMNMRNATEQAASASGFD